MHTSGGTLPQVHLQFNSLCEFIATHAHLCGMAHPYRLGVL